MQATLLLRAMALLVGTWAAAAVAETDAPGNSPAPSRSTWGSIYLPRETVPMEPIRGGMGSTLLDGRTATFRRFVLRRRLLDAGSDEPIALPPAQEEVVIVTQGRVELLALGQTYAASAGWLIFVGLGADRRLANPGPGAAAYLSLAVTPDPMPEGSTRGRILSTGAFNPKAVAPRFSSLGESHWFIDSPTSRFKRLICHTTTLQPGEATPVGRDEADELTVVLSGYVQTTINGVSARLGPGSAFLQASLDLHTNRDVGNFPATYMVVKIVTSRTPAPPR